MFGWNIESIMQIYQPSCPWHPFWGDRMLYSCIISESKQQIILPPIIEINSIIVKLANVFKNEKSKETSSHPYMLLTVWQWMQWTIFTKEKSKQTSPSPYQSETILQWVLLCYMKFTRKAALRTVLQTGPGARPTNDISIEFGIRPKFAVL